MKKIELTPKQQIVLNILDREGKVSMSGFPGDGKTTAMICAALTGMYTNDYRALILRQDGQHLQQLLDTLEHHFDGYNYTYNTLKREWTFPSGAKLKLASVRNHQDAVSRFAGSEFDFIGIDDIQLWGEDAPRLYQLLASRMRKPGARIFVTGMMIEDLEKPTAAPVSKLVDLVDAGLCGQ